MFSQCRRNPYAGLIRPAAILLGAILGALDPAQAQNKIDVGTVIDTPPVAAAPALIERSYKVPRGASARLATLLETIIDADPPTTLTAQRRVTFDKNDRLNVRATPENIEKIEDLLLDHNSFRLLRDETLDAAYFSLVPPGEVEPSDQVREMMTRIVKMIEVSLYTQDGQAKAANRGHRMWFNSYTLDLVVFDTPANLARVRAFLAALAQPALPAAAGPQTQPVRPPSSLSPATREILGRRVYLPAESYATLRDFMEALAKAIPPGFQYRIEPGAEGESIQQSHSPGTPLHLVLDRVLGTDIRSWSVDGRGIFVIEPRTVTETYNTTPAQARRIRAMLDSGDLQRAAWGQVQPPSPKFHIRLDEQAGTLELAATAPQLAKLRDLLATIPPHPAATPTPRPALSTQAATLSPLQGTLSLRSDLLLHVLAAIERQEPGAHYRLWNFDSARRAVQGTPEFMREFDDAMRLGVIADMAQTTASLSEPARKILATRISFRIVAAISLPEFMRNLWATLPEETTFTLTDAEDRQTTAALLSNFEEMPARQVLDVVLHPLGLAWRFTDQNMFVITPALITKAWPLDPDQRDQVRALLEAGDLQHGVWGGLKPPFPGCALTLDEGRGWLVATGTARHFQRLDALLHAHPPVRWNVRIYKIAPQDTPRVQALLAEDPPTGPTRAGLPRRHLLTSNTLILCDTRAEIRRIEGQLAAQKLLPGNAPPKLFQAVYSLAPGGIVSHNAQTKNFCQIIEESVTWMMPLWEDSPAQAWAQGRRTWFDAGTLQLTVIDTPDRLARVGRYLASLGKNLSPAAPPVPLASPPPEPLKSYVIYHADLPDSAAIDKQLLKEVARLKTERNEATTGTRLHAEVIVEPLEPQAQAVLVRYRDDLDEQTVADLINRLYRERLSPPPVPIQLHFLMIRNSSRFSSATQTFDPAADPRRLWGAQPREFTAHPPGRQPVTVRLPVTPLAVWDTASAVTRYNRNRFNVIFCCAQNVPENQKATLDIPQPGAATIRLRLTPRREPDGRITLENLALERRSPAPLAPPPPSGWRYDITLHGQEYVVLTDPDFPGDTFLLSGFP